MTLTGGRLRATEPRPSATAADGDWAVNRSCRSAAAKRTGLGAGTHAHNSPPIATSGSGSNTLLRTTIRKPIEDNLWVSVLDRLLRCSGRIADRRLRVMPPKPAVDHL